MKKLPAAIFIIDPRKERIAVAEAHKLNIPIVSIVDTNCDPDEIDKVIPGNDDAIRAVRLLTSKMADAVIEANRANEQAELEKETEEEAAENRKQFHNHSIITMLYTKGWYKGIALYHPFAIEKKQAFILRRNITMAITAGMVKELRAKTGAGMMDCKKALRKQTEIWIRQLIIFVKKVFQSAKKADRVAAEGLSSVLIEGNKAVILEINAETDFVAKNENFQALVKDVLPIFFQKSRQMLTQHLLLRLKKE